MKYGIQIIFSKSYAFKNIKIIRDDIAYGCPKNTLIVTLRETNVENIATN